MTRFPVFVDLDQTAPLVGVSAGAVSGSQVALGSMGAAPSVDLGLVANKLVMVTGTLTANCALTLSNLAAGDLILLLLTQDGTGGWMLSVNGTSVPISTTLASSSVVQCEYDGTNLYVSLLGGGGSSGGVTPTNTVTLTNKRITNRVATITQSATPAINSDNMDVASITGLAQAITSMTTNLTGTPVDGDTLLIRLTDNGTGRAITWGAKFEASTVALPTTTVASTLLTVQFIWNTVTSKWRCVGAA